MVRAGMGGNPSLTHVSSEGGWQGSGAGCNLKHKYYKLKTQRGCLKNLPALFKPILAVTAFPIVHFVHYLCSKTLEVSIKETRRKKNLHSMGPNDAYTSFGPFSSSQYISKDLKVN